MSARERQVIAELTLWLIVLFFIWMRLTDGVTVLGQSFGSQIVAQSPGKLLWAYLSAMALAGVGQAIIRLVIFRKNRGEAFLDERDIHIERKAEQIAYGAGIFAINVLIGHILLNELFQDKRVTSFDVVTPAGIVLALLTILVLQELVRSTSSLVLYRKA
jgi:hypothetical protein